MFKYAAALSLLAVMATTIVIIDAHSAATVEVIPPSGEGARSATRIYATGIVEGATPDIHLRPEHPGRVTQVLVAAGDWVEAGQVVVRQDRARHEQEVALATARLELARAELERLANGARPEERAEVRALHRAARTRLEQAVRTSNRVEQLRGERAISQQEADDHLAHADTFRAEFEAAEARVEQIEAAPRADEMRAAEAGVAAAEAELGLATVNFYKTELRAPRSARVLEVNVEPGELTGPDAPRPLVVLSDMSVIRVRAYVEEFDAPRVHVGMSATITADGLPNQQYTGRVVSNSPRMQAKSVYGDRPGELYDAMVREVLVEVDETEPMIVGLRVDVSFVIEQELSTDAYERLSAAPLWEPPY